MHPDLVDDRQLVFDCAIGPDLSDSSRAVLGRSALAPGCARAQVSWAYGISKRALQEWEQGGRQPDSAARAYRP